MRRIAHPSDATPIRREGARFGDALDGVKVAWVMPNYGPLYSEVYASHMCAIAYANRTLNVMHGSDIPMVGCTDRMYIHSACNYIIQQVLLQENITHIFWTESDMILPKDVIPKLLKVGKAIVSGIYFLRGGGGQPCLYKRTPLEVKENPYLHTPITVYDERGPFRVDCPGMGCVLMERKVFETIPEPWFDLKANDPGLKNGYGQDLFFYTKVRWAGIEVWATPDVVCDQIDTYVVGYKDYRKKLAENKGNFGGFIALDASQQPA